MIKELKVITTGLIFSFLLVLLLMIISIVQMKSKMDRSQLFMMQEKLSCEKSYSDLKMEVWNLEKNLFKLQIEKKGKQ